MNRYISTHHYDAIIVGARCAGATTAMLLARQGARVLLIDRAPEIGDTLSTHALMRPAVELLARWGLLDTILADTLAVTRTTFHYGDEAVPVDIAPGDGVPGLCAPRRHVLDAALVAAARASGAEVRLGTACEGPIRGRGGRVIGAELRLPDGNYCSVTADIVIGADGRISRIAQAVGAPVRVAGRERLATLYGYFEGIPDTGFRWYFAPGLQAGIIPTTAGRSCVFASLRPVDFADRIGTDSLGGLVSVIGAWEPEIAAGMKRTRSPERLRRFPGAAGHIRDCTGPGWALVGDAGCFKDPTTAHGISDALLDADRLARAIASDRLTDYNAERDAHADGIFATTEAIAAFDWTYPQLKALHLRMGRLIKAECPSARNRVAA